MQQDNAQITKFPRGPMHPTKDWLTVFSRMTSGFAMTKRYHRSQKKLLNAKAVNKFM